MKDQRIEHGMDLEDPLSYQPGSSRLRVYVACSLTNESRPDLRDRLLSEVREIFAESLLRSTILVNTRSLDHRTEIMKWPRLTISRRCAVT